MNTRYKNLVFFLFNFFIIFNLNAMSKDEPIVEITNSTGQGNFSITACSLFGYRNTILERLGNNQTVEFSVGKDCDLIRVAPEITFSLDDIDNGFGETVTVKEAESALALAFAPVKGFGAITRITIVNALDDKKTRSTEFCAKNSIFGFVRE